MPGKEQLFMSLHNQRCLNICARFVNERLLGKTISKGCYEMVSVPPLPHLVVFSIVLEPTKRQAAGYDRGRGRSSYGYGGGRSPPRRQPVWIEK